MFATVNISSNPQASQPQSGLDLLNNVAVGQKPMDFNTMQNLFATQNPNFSNQNLPMNMPVNLNLNVGEVKPNVGTA